ncbi:MAG: radical SAM protein [Thermoguttaceae bacterium]|nr:radical SAM protein [Thermoguttaceae bacterium]MDW8036819.1 radical SAM protein [Thermoguttaceae bacterium]
MPETFPAYLELWKSGELQRRAELALAQLANCAMCGRRCHANRLAYPDSLTDIHSQQDTYPHTPPTEWGDSHRLTEAPAEDSKESPHPNTLNPPSAAGTQENQPNAPSPVQRRPFCRTGRRALVSSFFPHHGEEPCLRGWGGSGTIFFTHCNLRCVFCQNWDISWQGEGQPVQADQLARMMLWLQRAGCHNINFVTPSHVVPQILEALVLAAEGGLRLPLVYNTGGYDLVETLRLLDGVIDIYMPDVKFLDPQLAHRWTAAPDYPEVVRAAVREMYRQVGDLEIDEQGLARRGLLVRHLVMPGASEDTEQVMRFLAEEISPNTFVNVMAQYHPEGRAWHYPELARRIRPEEYRQAVAAARRYGLRLCRD